MTIRIVDGTAHVDTASEAIQASDYPGVKDVVVENNMERIKLNKILRAFA